MHKFDTIQGKLFYTVYMMHQQNQIDSKQKGKLKDLIIQQHPSIDKIETDNTIIVRKSLLDLAEEQEKIQYPKKQRVVKPINTNSKYRLTRSLVSSPSRR